MPNRHPFDILLDNGIRINVKSAWSGRIPPSQIGKCINPSYHFNLLCNKLNNADIFILVIPDTKDMFIIPADILPKSVTNITMCWPTARPEIGKYQKYLNRWDLLDRQINQTVL